MPDKPSRNPANDDGLVGALRVVITKMQQEMDNRLPVRVIEYDRTTNRTRVEHQLQMVTTDGTLVNRTQVASVPALVLGAGDFFINFNIQNGNLGWIQACDRDISLFLQNYQKAPPNDGRLDDFSSGLFVPDVMTGYTIDGEDSGSMVIQNSSANVKLSLNASRIKATVASTEFLIDAGQIKATVGGTDVLTMTSANATFGVPHIDSNGVTIDTHVHSQGLDSAGDVQVNTNAPQN